jgi:uncharacterized secreted protein with C-terminal beta-propeller domain
VPAALVSYGDCRRLVRGLRREAAAEVGPYGLPFGYAGAGTAGIAGNGPLAVGAGGAAAGSAAMAPAAAAVPAAPAYSTTNNQEAGVDEPDLVKTDGHLMVVMNATSTLNVIDVARDHPALLGSLAFPGAQNAKALLLGDDAIVLAQTYQGNGTSAVASVVSLADPAHPRVVRTYSTQGQLVDARLLHGRVVLVVQSTPHLVFAGPKSNAPDAVATAVASNRRVIRRAKLRDWLPALTVMPAAKTFRPACAKTFHPGIASGLGTTAVITLDPTKDEPTQQLTVVGTSSVVYASTEALYLATTSWNVQRLVTSGSSGEPKTDIHGFNISSPDHLSYLGTGSVAGSLTDQYAMSEHNGFLRVATTIGSLLPPPGEGQAPAQLSDNHVTVLQPVDGVLVQVGQVAGLGRGERIYGVRFMGSIGYVVTFRQTDPLYVLDLSDPRRPRTRGELKVTGFSSSLYPLDDGMLLGVGQGVDAHLRQIGTQVSVFDVRRLSRPALRSRVQLKGGFSLAETDHHSLLWWPTSRTLVVPLSVYSRSRFDGSIVYTVSSTGALLERGRVQPPERPNGCCGGVIRSVVVGDLLYSVTPRGLVTNRIDRLDHQGWLPFP